MIPSGSTRKRGQNCSVENLSAAENHYVEGERFKDDLARLGPVAARSQCGAPPALDHTMPCSELPSWPVLACGKSLLHLVSPVASQRFRRRPASRGRNDRADAALLTRKHVRS